MKANERSSARAPKAQPGALAQRVGPVEYNAQQQQGASIASVSGGARWPSAPPVAATSKTEAGG